MQLRLSTQCINRNTNQCSGLLCDRGPGRDCAILIFHQCMHLIPVVLCCLWGHRFVAAALASFYARPVRTSIAGKWFRTLRVRLCVCCFVCNRCSSASFVCVGAVLHTQCTPLYEMHILNIFSWFGRTRGCRRGALQFRPRVPVSAAVTRRGVGRIPRHHVAVQVRGARVA